MLVKLNCRFSQGDFTGKLGGEWEHNGVFFGVFCVIYHIRKAIQIIWN